MERTILRHLSTPLALVDRKILRTNTRRMAAKARAHDVRLRPHVKTHKCAEAARFQIDGHFGGITVSTLAEAEFFAQQGFMDITYAVPISQGKLARACALAQSISQLHLLVDHSDLIPPLGNAAATHDIQLSVLIKIDCGYHRAGLRPKDPRLVPLARSLHLHTHLNFEGVLTHAGHSYDCIGEDALKVVAIQERQEILEAARIITDAEIPVRTISVGSTPTMAVVENLKGITEIRPGNYTLFDRTQAAIGSCTIDDIALSVLTEVIGVYPERKMILVDAGALALSKDAGATHAENNDGFGLVCDTHGALIEGLTVIGLSQEHGKIVYVGEHHFNIGDRLRILPNHSCLVTALFRTLHVIEEGELVDEWIPNRGW